MTPEEQVARVTTIEHSIIGTEHPRQGITQTVPEMLVLCLSCGWMRCSEYGDHLAAEVVKALGLREEWRIGVADSPETLAGTWIKVRLVTDWREVE